MRALALAGAALLGGCSPATPPVVVAGAPPVPVPGAVVLRLTAGDAVASELDRRLESALLTALTRHGIALTRHGTAVAQHGIAVAPGAAWQLDVATALAPAGLGVTQDNSSAHPPWRAAPRRRHLFDRCRAQRLRVTLSGGLAGQVPSYHASGSFADCAPGDAAIAALAERMAVGLVSPAG